MSGGGVVLSINSRTGVYKREKLELIGMRPAGRALLAHLNHLN